jgi:hypothetical protein
MRLSPGITYNPDDPRTGATCATGFPGSELPKLWAAFLPATSHNVYYVKYCLSLNGQRNLDGTFSPWRTNGPFLHAWAC